MKSITLMFLCLVLFGASNVARAQQTTPKHDYPLTNRGTCERLHDQGMEVRGASLQQVINLCAKNGIKL